MNLDTPQFSIGGLAARTGIAVPTLRAWERRYGLPVPVRLPGGHRRYTQRDVDTVNEIKERRNLGSRLSEAMMQAKARAEIPRSSILRTVEYLLGDVTPVVLSKPMLVTLSRAIEDEATARADRPVMVGTFQAEAYHHQSRSRWQALARASLATITFFVGAEPQDLGTGTPWTVPLEPSHPLTREWAVLCDSPSFAVCLVGTERLPEGNRPVPRRFETLWTVEPRVVREATRTAVALAEPHFPDLGSRLAGFLGQAPASEALSGRNASALITRMAGYLDH
jgi:DNA-binding transcriptional MerR regulator